MRDPDLVQRAEHAAGALERAWDRWRTMHGFGSAPLAPVSSYVGYSMEEPWGQPRVVFGVAANEAEQLAALLDGHDCYGPVHAEVAGRPDWRRMPSRDAGTSAWAIDDLSIPQQARPPAADMLPPVMPDVGAPELAGNVLGPNAVDASALEEPGATFASGGGRAKVGPTGSDGTAEPIDQAESVDEDAMGTPSELTPQELAPLPPLPDPSPAGPVGSASLAPVRTRKNAKASRGPAYRGPRYQGSSPRYKAAPDAAKPAQADAEDASAGSAAATVRAADAGPAAPDAADPRVAPEAAIALEAAVAPEATAAPDTAVRSETAVELDAAVAPEANAVLEADAAPDTAADPDTAKAADRTVDKPAADSASKPARARSRQASKVNRTRRQGPGAHEAWDSKNEESADRAL